MTVAYTSLCHLFNTDGGLRFSLRSFGGVVHNKFWKVFVKHNELYPHCKLIDKFSFLFCSFCFMNDSWG